MAEPLVIVGAGGFGREVIQIVRTLNRALGDLWDLKGVLDDAPSEMNLARLERIGVRYLGGTNATEMADEALNFVVGVGSPSARRRIAEGLEGRGWKPATLIHPAATVGSDVSVGDGTIICTGARLTTNITVGRHVQVDTNATVGHDTDLGDYVRLNPASSISGDCAVGEGALVGVGAVVLNQLTIGRDAVVGGGACVVRDVPPSTTVKGVPAR